MKKLIVVFAAIAITAGAYAQADSKTKKVSPDNNNASYGTTNQDNTNLNQNMQNTPGDKSQADGVVMQNGKMMQVKNGQVTSFKEKDMTLSNGTKIMSDGTCIKKDGSKVMMKEGQHMDMSGNMTTSKLNKNENMYLVPDSTKK